ncbi:MAG: hypothetical protein H2069_00445 [Legionella sp.]|nr:hypothetical protein [Legionella sp.]
MVDEKKPEDDGYTFSELDDFDLHADDTPFGEEKETPFDENEIPPKPKAVNVRRNAIIAIGVVALLMLGYQFVEAYLQRKHVPSQKSQVMPAPIVTTPVPTRVAPPVEVPQTKPVVTTPVVSDNAPVLRELTTVENQQQALRSSLDTLQNAVNSINSRESDLTEKISELTQTLSALVSKLDQQTAQIEHLVERTRRPKVIKRRQPKQPPAVYTMQAVIPGRAWLISENGATITVNVGTSLRGYGTVRLIDAKQGRVLTSSGRVIRFGQ